MILIYVQHGHVIQVEQEQLDGTFKVLKPDVDIDGFHVVYLDELNEGRKGNTFFPPRGTHHLGKEVGTTAKTYKITKVYKVIANSKQEAIEKMQDDPDSLEAMYVSEVVEKGFISAVKQQLTGK